MDPQLGRSASSSSISKSYTNHHPSVFGDTPYNTTRDADVGYSSSLGANSINRGNSTGSYLSYTGSEYAGFSGSAMGTVIPNNVNRHPSEILQAIGNYGGRGPLELHDDDEGEYWEDEEEEDESRFINFSLLSHIAVQLRDKVPRGTHVKGSIPYPRAFTGKDIVVSLVACYDRHCPESERYMPTVNNPVTNPTRAGHQPWCFYKRPKSSAPSRSQPPKPTILL